jgi:elongation factor G
VTTRSSAAEGGGGEVHEIRLTNLAVARPRKDLLVISARAPLASTFDYVSRLRGLTRGRGTAVIRPDRYEVAPESLAASVIG